MYRFEIRSEEGPDSSPRYRWELLLSTSGGREEVVAESKQFPSWAEAESEVRAFRRAVARAGVAEPPARSPDPTLPAVSFRRLPDVTTLPATAWRRYDPHATDAGRDRHHLGVPAPEPQIEAEAQTEAGAQAEAGARAEGGALAGARAGAGAQAGARAGNRARAGARAGTAARAGARAGTAARAGAAARPLPRPPSPSRPGTARILSYVA